MRSSRNRSDERSEALRTRDDQVRAVHFFLVLLSSVLKWFGDDFREMNRLGGWFGERIGFERWSGRELRSKFGK